VVAAWTALVQLYLALGAWFLVSLMALIWCADIAAYFAGKAFGRHKLAPRVSPGKTWEGAVGGVVAATLWVFVSRWWPGSFGDVLASQWPLWGVAIIAVLLAALSIVGDLFESLLKRRAGVKDSSQLLPGHGGVYDRIDALLPVAPIALLLSGVSM
jgi:phosphatidate cytidylyltransferase